MPHNAKKKHKQAAAANRNASSTRVTVPVWRQLRKRMEVWLMHVIVTEKPRGKRRNIAQVQAMSGASTGLGDFCRTVRTVTHLSGVVLGETFVCLPDDVGA